MSEALEDAIVAAIKAGHRVLVLRGDDEASMMELAEAVADRLGHDMRTYSRTEGIDGSGGLPSAQFIREGLHAQGSSLWVARDLLREGDSFLRRALREQALDIKSAPVLCLESQLDERMLAPEFWVLRFTPPDLHELEERISTWAQAQRRESDSPLVEGISSNAPGLARQALGLGWRECRLAMREAIEAQGAQLPGVQEALRAAKARRLSAQGMVEAMAETPDDQLGGLEAFKRWLAARALAFEPDARAAAIPSPRGVLLIGVQGCGKSLAARVCAHTLELPLYRLDPGRIFTGIVGASESRLDELLELLDRMSPLVLWLDEIDKSLAGAESSSSDGGTTSRVIGRLLTWMQEREEPVFVVATANDPSRLPPEMLRRGRFDEVFFVDLPGAEARAEILDIHLRRKPAANLDQVPPLSDEFDAYLDLARGAEGFSGAELEATLIEARLNAYAQGEPLSAAHLHAAIKVTVPLSTSRNEDIDALRSWAKTRARRA